MLELSQTLGLTGRIVTINALHAQHETMRCLRGRGADASSPGMSNGPPLVSPMKATPMFAGTRLAPVRSIPAPPRLAVRSA